MGFTVNGFGTTDKLYPLKYLGHYICPYCKKDSEFNLSEAKKKIALLYIPTLTLTSKFAVICRKCERGIYVDESVKNALLSGDMFIETEEDGIAVYKKN